MPKANRNGEVSIYTDALVTDETIAEQFAILHSVYPDLHAGFFSVLFDAVKEQGFTEQRLKQAVKHVISTVEYPSFTPAKILGFDMKYKLYSHSEMLNEINDFRATAKDFAKVKRNGRVYWVKQSDKVMYNIPNEL